MTPKLEIEKKEDLIPSGRAAPTSKSPESPNAGATWAGEGGMPGMSVHDPSSCIVLMMTMAKDDRYENEHSDDRPKTL